MNRFAIMASLAALVAAAPLAAEVLTIPGEHVGYGIPSGFVIQNAGMDFNDEYTYIWVDAEGNCRWDTRTECWTGNNGQVHCRTIREWKCDRAATYYRMPPSFTVDEDAKRADFTAEGATPLAYGKVKSFLWSKWIGLLEGAELLVNYDGAAVKLDTEVLATSLKKAQFEELYSTTPDAD